MQDLDQEYDRLMDELEAAVAESDCGERGRRIMVIRRRIEGVLRAQMVFSRPAPSRSQSSSLQVLH